MHVIPAIDLLNGDCVRLHKGDYDQATIYNKDPLSQAKTFAEAGFTNIHVVDLNGAKQGEFINLEYIQEMIHQLGLSVQTGGGIRHFEDAKNYSMLAYQKSSVVLWPLKMRPIGCN